jgi:hypothetical protein
VGSHRKRNKKGTTLTSIKNYGQAGITTAHTKLHNHHKTFTTTPLSVGHKKAPHHGDNRDSQKGLKMIKGNLY